MLTLNNIKKYITKYENNIKDIWKKTLKAKIVLFTVFCF